MSKRLNTIDLFSGAGGFSLGFSKAKFNIIGALEINKKYAQTHELNFKNSKTIEGDIREWTPERFSCETGITPENVDIIIGGPPCQTFSSIGTPKINSITGNKLKEDHRNYLYKNFYDYVEYFRPEVFIMENVPTMMTKYKGHLFNNLIAKIKEINYKPFHSILNSVNFGVPQIRKRLFIIGFANRNINYSFPPSTHFSPDEKGQEKLLSRYVTVKDAIDDLPEIYDGIREHYLPYSSFKPNSLYQRTLRNGNRVVGNNICRMSNDRAKKVFSYMNQGEKYMDLAPEIRRILPFREDIFHDRLKRLSLNKPSWTVLAHIGMDGYMYIHPIEDRTLSVREAARIQSFDDGFEFVGNMREQYIQVGNSVPPLLAYALAKSIKNTLDK
jgi:DNA (cytosine-5)-methyltransferase 1